LEAGIKNGKFRKDLFFRINVVTIKMPSLSDRKEDIPALIRHFLERYDSKKPATQISDEAPGTLDGLRLAR
jgi:DNA-binding NtrC family response regulator